MIEIILGLVFAFFLGIIISKLFSYFEKRRLRARALKTMKKQDLIVYNDLNAFIKKDKKKVFDMNKISPVKK